MHKLVTFGDIGFGMLTGILLVLKSSGVLATEYGGLLLLTSLILFGIFALLNLVFNFGYMKQHHITKLAVLHGLIDVLIVITLIPFFTQLPIQFLELLFGFYQQTYVLLGIGIFLFVTNLFWVFVE